MSSIYRDKVAVSPEERGRTNLSPYIESVKVYLAVWADDVRSEWWFPQNKSNFEDIQYPLEDGPLLQQKDLLFEVPMKKIPNYDKWLTASSPDSSGSSSTSYGGMFSTLITTTTIDSMTASNGTDDASSSELSLSELAGLMFDGHYFSSQLSLSEVSQKTFREAGKATTLAELNSLNLYDNLSLIHI